MEPRFLMLVRYAEVVPDGTVNIIGGSFEKLVVDEFPATFPILNVIAKIALTQEEAGEEHPYRTSICGPDGEIVNEGVSGIIHVGDVPTKVMSIFAALVFPFVNTIFPTEGWYKVALHINETEFMSTSLRVVDRETEERFQRAMREKNSGQSTVQEAEISVSSDTFDGNAGGSDSRTEPA